MRVWDLQAGNLRGKHDGPRWRVTALTFSADSKLLASANADGIITLWNLTDDTKRDLTQPHPVGSEYANSLALSPDGKHLACGT